MSQTLALVPAKFESTGVPGKNWKPIVGHASCVELAISIGLSTCEQTVFCTDVGMFPRPVVIHGERQPTWIGRPADLCTPEASMLDVVTHALAQVPGPDDEIIVLLQPTSPLRTTETVTRAIQMLEADKAATSVVSVSPSYPVEWTLSLHSYGELYLQYHDFGLLGLMPSRRQDCEPAYKRDGVVYAFRRTTMREYLDIYGPAAMALHTPPAESLSIDTPADWDEAVRRLNQR